MAIDDAHLYTDNLDDEIGKQLRDLQITNLDRTETRGVNSL
jgi:hypothetical protein